MILIGDTNIDMSALYLNEHEKTNTHKSQNIFMKSIKVNLLEKGMKLMNNSPTFHRDNYSSQLDNIFVNNSSKISNIIQISDTPSDHDIIGLQRIMKCSQVEEQYLLVRNLNKIEPFEANNKVITHPLISQKL